MSQANDIAAGVESALLASGLAADRVTRSRRRLRKYRQYPAIGVYLSGDQPSSSAGSAPIGFEYREVEIELELCATGPVPEGVTSQLHGDVNAIVMAAFPGDVRRGGVQWAGDPGNPSLGIVRAQYLIFYRRLEGEL